MSTTVEYTILAEDGPVTVQAEPATPGLYIYKQPDTVDVGASCRWRIGHHSGVQVARFRTADDARSAVVHLVDWVDWTEDSKILATTIANRSDAPEFLRIIDDCHGHLGNCAHPEPDSDWLPNGGHTGPMCAYVAGMSARCTCD
ncbi:hypothetical protein [Kitasatospora sp. NPDC056531]|uniref:hypothetical protein n=1 Tax=Kitasatospora sp. NPDC056531 TaxID=3345856 RepID=UPI0036AA7EEF